MKTSTAILLLMILLIPVGMRGAVPQIPGATDGFGKGVYVDSLNRRMPYRLLEPERILGGEKFPLVVFLHGYGERGDDNERQLSLGAGMFTNPVNSERYPAYVLFPQTKERSWIVEERGDRTFMPGAVTQPISATEEVLMELVDDVIANKSVDTSRIYLVGVSMGGVAVYDLACRFPEKFAAVIPICGAVNPDRLKDARDVSFMIFHGEDDELVPLICGRGAYKALNAAGASVVYVEFPGLGHECWDAAFNYPTFMPWLFSQVKDNCGEMTAEEHSRHDVSGKE